MSVVRENDDNGMVSDVDFRPEDAPLKSDVSRLGRWLGQVLRRAEGEEFFAAVEKARTTAIAERSAGTDGAISALPEQLSGHSPEHGGRLARAFSAFFGLLNTAERVHRIRRARAYEIEGVAQRDGIGHTLRRLQDQGVSAAVIRSLLTHLRLRPVFTAHPTESSRRALLDKQRQIARFLLRDMIETGQTPRAHRRTQAALRRHIATAWQTDDRHGQAPTVAEEVEHVAFFVSDVIYPVLPELLETLDRELLQVFDAEPVGFDGQVDPPIAFASWVGGDMDGNPNVGPKTITATLERQRALVLRRYRGEIESLFDFMTHGDRHTQPSDEVVRRTAHNFALIGDSMRPLPERYRAMPYRAFAWSMAGRIDATQVDGGARYAQPDELRSDLQTLISSLLTHEDPSGSVYHVRRLLQRVHAFGFHLCSLDIRQDALVHRQHLAVLLVDDRYGQRSAADRATILRQRLRAPVPALCAASAELGSIQVMTTLGESLGRFGSQAIGPYVVSMTQAADDALSVLVLAREAGLGGGSSGEDIPLDVVPLFETVPDLQAAAATMADLLDDDMYRQHLRQRGDRQMVMLGYSDSNKESGLAAARWALYRAQEDLVRLFESAAGDGVQLRLFHGRGGSVSRGGGKERNGILSAPPGAVQSFHRVTEQGEMISMRYGLRGIAERSMEVSIGAMIEHELLPPPNISTAHGMDRFGDIATLVAARARVAYRALVYDNPDFAPYFRSATPIDIIEKLRIGSRPPSRRSGQGIGDLRAIPWVFSWTQSRNLLPGWYGLGEGLRCGREKYGLEALQHMAEVWPFFSALMNDAEVVLAKADMRVAQWYAELAVETGELGDRALLIFEQIKTAHRCTVEEVIHVRRHESLLDADPVLRRGIRLRNPYVDPMNSIQVDLLRRWRLAPDGPQTAEIEAALFSTIKGIAQGMQNTG